LEDNIKIYLKEGGRTDSCGSGQGPVAGFVNRVKKVRIP
jgi:hypothetical protein